MGNSVSVEFEKPVSDEVMGLIADSCIKAAEKYGKVQWCKKTKECPERVYLRALERIGGEPGKTGSHVFFAQLFGKEKDNKTGEINKTWPVVVKVMENGDRDVLKIYNEFDNFNRVKDYLFGNNYAGPVYIWPSEPTISSPGVVLWTECPQITLKPELPDKPPIELRHVLEEKRFQDAEKILRETYKVVLGGMMHNGTSRSDNIDVFDKFERSGYLRDPERWKPLLSNYLGDEKNSDSISIYDEKVANPLKYFNELEGGEGETARSFPIKIGAVHGDLHPRNILTGNNKDSCLIDFGWANDDFPVIVDYILMECSIKFFYQPWHVPIEDFTRLEKDLLEGGKDVNGRHGYICGAKELITFLRDLAKDHLADKDVPVSESKEYLLPLFLITMGYFKLIENGYPNPYHLVYSAGVIANRLRELL